MGYTFHVGTALKGACAFSPLQIVFSVAVGVIFLGDTLHSGGGLAEFAVAKKKHFDQCCIRWCRSLFTPTGKAGKMNGQGYSLPADIQYLDARWEIPIVLPLRDCFAQEINMLCRLDGFVVL
ncbi:hypothetical protein JHK82_039747 [Glycine max]|nr:hypothetical protein JHK82_039747 [Glycine max]